MSEGIEGEVSRLVAEALGLEPDEVGPEASMDSLDVWDSLQHLGVVMAVEARFGCRLSPEEVTELTSVAAIAEHLRRAG